MGGKNALLIYNARLIDKNIDLPSSAILMQNGFITGFPQKEVLQELLKDKDIESLDAKGKVLLPSFIDMHAHFRDPGLTQKEDIETGSKAAAAGGFGTVTLMPNTSPVVSSKAQALINDQKGEDAGYARIIQSVSITKDFDGKTLSHLEALDSETVPLITEDGKEVQDSSVMLEAMRIAKQKSIIVSCHCEDPFLAVSARPLRAKALSCTNKEEAASLLREADSLLYLAEDVATFRNIRLAQEAGCHIHLCHVSTKNCIEAVRSAKERGIHITCEITPHHLSLDTEDSANVFHIVNPPIRAKEDRDALIKALLDGTADVIATDHAPHTQSDKEAGSPGFSGLETAFATCNTVLCHGHGMSLQKLSSIMSARPAQILNLSDRGLLKEGYEADVVLLDPNEEVEVNSKNFFSKGKYTPQEGKTLKGRIYATVLKGHIVYKNEN